MRQKWHKVRYVLRSTFDQELVDLYRERFEMDAKQIWKGWRNTVEFGKLGAEDLRKKSNLHHDVAKFISKNLAHLWAIWVKETKCSCPICGGTIKWEMIMPTKAWNFDAQGDAVLSPREYERACTMEWRQILLC